MLMNYDNNLYEVSQHKNFVYALKMNGFLPSNHIEIEMFHCHRFIRMAHIILLTESS